MWQTLLTRVTQFSQNSCRLPSNNHFLCHWESKCLDSINLGADTIGLHHFIALWTSLTTNSETVQHSTTLLLQVCLSLYPIVQFGWLHCRKWYEKSLLYATLQFPFCKWQQNWFAGLNWVGYIQWHEPFKSSMHVCAVKLSLTPEGWHSHAGADLDIGWYISISRYYMVFNYNTSMVLQ